MTKTIDIITSNPSKKPKSTSIDKDAVTPKSEPKTQSEVKSKTKSQSKKNHLPKNFVKTLKSGIYKNKKIACLACFLIIIAVILAVVVPSYVATHPPLNEEFFTSDDTKEVISLDSDRPASNSGSSLHTRIVYSYDGDNVVGLKTYFEYADEAAAAAAFETTKELPEYKGAVLEGKYIVVAAPEDQFKGLTKSDIEQQSEAIRQFQTSQKAKNQTTKNNTEETSEE